MKTIDDAARVTTVTRQKDYGLLVRYACGHGIVLSGEVVDGRWRTINVGPVYAETAAAIDRTPPGDRGASTLLLRGHPDCPMCAPPALASPSPRLPLGVERPDAFVAPVALTDHDWLRRVRRVTGAWLAQYRSEDGRWCIVVGLGPDDLYAWDHRTWFGARAALQTELGLPAGRVDAVPRSSFERFAPRCGVLVRDWEAVHGPRIADIGPPRSEKPVLEQALDRLRNASPAYINDLSVKAGVYTKDGKLTKAFGGKG